MCFMKVMALELLLHLENHSGNLVYMDIEMLKNEPDEPYHIIKIQPNNEPQNGEVMVHGPNDINIVVSSDAILQK